MISGTRGHRDGEEIETRAGLALWLLIPAIAKRSQGWGRPAAKAGARYGAWGGQFFQGKASGEEGEGLFDAGGDLGRGVAEGLADFQDGGGRRGEGLECLDCGWPGYRAVAGP